MNGGDLSWLPEPQRSALAGVQLVGRCGGACHLPRLVDVNGEAWIGCCAWGAKGCCGRGSASLFALEILYTDRPRVPWGWKRWCMRSEDWAESVGKRRPLAAKLNHARLINSYDRDIAYSLGVNEWQGMTHKAIPGLVGLRDGKPIAVVALDVRARGVLL